MQRPFCFYEQFKKFAWELFGWSGLRFIDRFRLPLPMAHSKFVWIGRCFVF
jgi:hypothetical protein